MWSWPDVGDFLCRDTRRSRGRRYCRFAWRVHYRNLERADPIERRRRPTARGRNVVQGEGMRIVPHWSGLKFWHVRRPTTHWRERLGRRTPTRFERGGLPRRVDANAVRIYLAGVQRRTRSDDGNA